MVCAGGAPAHAASMVTLVATVYPVVSYTNKQGGLWSSQLWLDTQVLFNLLEESDLLIKAHHIPRRLNVIADQLSRQGQILPTELTLHQDIVGLIVNR